jgi:heat shock protein HslJ
MKTLSYYLLLLLIVFSACNQEDDSIEVPENIKGEWTIEGGGNLTLDDNSFTFSAGCNLLIGSVTIEISSLQFSPVATTSEIATTLVGCPEEEQNREQELSEILSNASFTFTVDGDRAQLFNLNGELILSLVRS